VAPILSLQLVRLDKKLSFRGWALELDAWFTSSLRFHRLPVHSSRAVWWTNLVPRRVQSLSLGTNGRSNVWRIFFLSNCKESTLGCNSAVDSRFSGRGCGVRRAGSVAADPTSATIYDCSFHCNRVMFSVLWDGSTQFFVEERRFDRSRRESCWARAAKHCGLEICLCRRHSCRHRFTVSYLQ